MSKIVRRRAPVHQAKNTAGHFIRIPIREVRPAYYLVDIHTGDGRRERKCFKDLEQAKVYCVQKDIELRNQGLSVFNMNDDQRRDAIKALEILNGRGSLVDATKFYVLHHPDTGGKTLAELVADFTAEQAKKNLRYRTLQTDKNRLGVLLKELDPDCKAASITTNDLDKILTNLNVSPVRRNGLRSKWWSLFGYALKHRVMAHNPAEGLSVAQVDETMPVFWPVEKVKALLHAVEKIAPEVAPMLAISFFAGVRISEIQELTWDCINLPERHIRILPMVAKKRRARLVTITDNLALWLGAYRKESGRIAMSVAWFQKRKKRLLKAAKITSWPNNVGRHSAATYHFALTQDAARVSTEMGHDVDVLLRHYRGLATKAEAVKYFSIAPHEAGKVIRLSAAG